MNIYLTVIICAIVGIIAGIESAIFTALAIGIGELVF